MPRYRTIKPEFFTSEQVSDCSPTARLLFVGLWCFCDDGGVHPLSAKRIKMEVFPADDFTTDQVFGWLQELLVVRLLQSYVVGGERFLHVTGWKHQKIDKPTYRFPQPESSTQFDDYSTTSLRLLIDSSPLEWNGVEGNGREKSRKDGSNEAAKRPSLQPARTSPENLAYPSFGCTQGRRNGPVTWLLAPEMIDELQQTFPAVDVPAECRKAWQWHKTNWTKRKTADGMPDFLRRWIARANDSGRGKARPTPPASRVPTAEDDANWNPVDGGLGGAF